MKLICEVNENIQVLKEASGSGNNYFIEGIFIQSEIKNRNGRIYPKEILDKEIQRYVTEYVDKKRAFGELGHPDGPSINLDRVSHMIISLTEDGQNYIGKAKIMDTPNGKIVKALIDEGASLGVSSRGMGSLRTESRTGSQVVQDDFYLATAGDIVADPSAPEAFVNGIMEGKEWIWDNGIIKEKYIAGIKKEIQKAPAKKIEEVSIKAFQDFMNKISGK